MTDFKIYGSDYWEIFKQKDFTLAVQSRMLDEVDRVKMQVEESLAKPQSGDKLELSRLEKVFPSEKEIYSRARSRSAHHKHELNVRKQKHRA
jgi:hypothetical protein